MIPALPSGSQAWSAEFKIKLGWSACDYLLARYNEHQHWLYVICCGLSFDKYKDIQQEIIS